MPGFMLITTVGIKGMDRNHQETLEVLKSELNKRE
jgi:hypothetical protein